MRGPTPLDPNPLLTAWHQGKQRKRRRKNWKRLLRKRSYAWPNSILNNSGSKVSRGLMKARVVGRAGLLPLLRLQASDGSVT